MIRVYAKKSGCNCCMATLDFNNAQEAAKAFKDANKSTSAYINYSYVDTTYGYWFDEEEPWPWRDPEDGEDDVAYDEEDEDDNLAVCENCGDSFEDDGKFYNGIGIVCSYCYESLSDNEEDEPYTYCVRCKDPIATEDDTFVSDNHDGSLCYNCYTIATKQVEEDQEKQEDQQENEDAKFVYGTCSKCESDIVLEDEAYFDGAWAGDLCFDCWHQIIKEKKIEQPIMF